MGNLHSTLTIAIANKRTLVSFVNKMDGNFENASM